MRPKRCHALLGLLLFKFTLDSQVHHDPSLASYLVAASAGAITPLVASSPMLAAATDVVVQQAPWWGPLAGAGATTFGLWLAGGVASVVKRALAAAVKARRQRILDDAARTKTKDDDEKAAIEAAALQAMADHLEK